MTLMFARQCNISSFAFFFDVASSFAAYELCTCEPVNNFRFAKAWEQEIVISNLVDSPTNC